MKEKMKIITPVFVVLLVLGLGIFAVSNYSSASAAVGQAPEQQVAATPVPGQLRDKIKENLKDRLSQKQTQQAPVLPRQQAPGQPRQQAPVLPRQQVQPNLPFNPGQRIMPFQNNQPRSAVTLQPGSTFLGHVARFGFVLAGLYALAVLGLLITSVVLLVKIKNRLRPALAAIPPPPPAPQSAIPEPAPIQAAVEKGPEAG